MGNTRDIGFELQTDKMQSVFPPSAPAVLADVVCLLPCKTEIVWLFFASLIARIFALNSSQSSQGQIRITDFLYGTYTFRYSKAWFINPSSSAPVGQLGITN